MKTSRTLTRKSRDIISRDHKVITPSAARPYDMVADHAQGSTIFDVDGNGYIDFASGVSVMNTGYGCKEVIDAVSEQMKKMFHCEFMDFYSEVPLRFAEKLCEMTGYNKVFLSNSGTESVEAGMKLAYWYTKRAGMLAFYGAFHGRTLGSLSLTCSKALHKEHFPSLRVVHAYYAYCYRCPFNLKCPDCGIACAQEIERTIFKRELSPEDTAAIVVEPIQGEGGIIVPPPEFHKELRRICDDNNVLLVADEVQSGCFRTGKFMALENFDIRADIVCMAKSIGGGTPAGATLSTDEIMSWPPGAHSSTFGGNLLASAAGLAALEFMETNRLGEKAVEQGAYLMKRLIELKDEYPIIGDVRGMGLMIGIEFVKKNKEPAAEKRDLVVKNAFNEGLILLPAGDSAIRFMPPLIITKEEIDCGLEMFEKALKAAGE